MIDATSPPSTVEQQCDTGLRCPSCDYNLTGLVKPHCPECGSRHTWADVRAYSARGPQIAFEKAVGWHKLPAFFTTALTVLFAPWVFGRQVTAWVSARHAGIFGAICFIATIAAHSLLFGGIPLLWAGPVVIHVAMQSLLLTALDPAGWRAPVRTCNFWLLTSCYTSAIMLTEIFTGPPITEFSTQWSFVNLRLFEQVYVAENRFLGVLGSTFADWAAYLIAHMQLGIWLVGLACCYLCRSRCWGCQRRTAAFMTGVAVISLFALYMFSVEGVGPWLYEVLE